jgi:hypothetical protein
VQAIHPDKLISNQLALQEAAVCESVKIVRLRLRNPPKSAEEYLATLQRQGLTQTVLALRVFSALL